MNDVQAPPAVEMSGPALPPAAFAADAALFKTLSDPIRLAVLAALERGPLTVTGIRATIGPVAWSKLSYHLGQLQKAGLITWARRSNWIDYEITPFGIVVYADDGWHARVRLVDPTDLGHQTDLDISIADLEEAVWDAGGSIDCSGKYPLNATLRERLGAVIEQPVVVPA